jgi:hypothetical protein
MQENFEKIVPDKIPLPLSQNNTAIMKLGVRERHYFSPWNKEMGK